MAKKSQKKKGIAWLIVLLVAVLAGGVVFVGAVAGWFGEQKVVLDAEYYCGENCEEFIELDVDTYEQLVANKKSFVVFVDQGGCTTADRLRGYAKDYMKEHGIKIYRMMFEDVRSASLHEKVKYYPSMVMVADGKVVGYLSADSNDDAGVYNNFDDFIKWMQRYL